jgi:hypothetical protein
LRSGAGFSESIEFRECPGWEDCGLADFGGMTSIFSNGVHAVGGRAQIIKSLGMRIWQIAFTIGLAGQSAISETQAWRVVPVPTTRQLNGLSSQDATDLIAKLEIAQRQLRAGKFQSFELLSGSIASYDKTKVSPREAFLQVPFRSVWEVERVRTDNELWQPYRLAYAPDGLGKLYWDIEVVLGLEGQIERVSMTYKSPAPS